LNPAGLVRIPLAEISHLMMVHAFGYSVPNNNIEPQQGSFTMLKSSIALAGTLVGAALIAGHSSPTLAQSIKAETATGCPHTVMILSAKYAARAGVNIQVNEGKTLTKSAMLVALKKIDIASFVPAPYVFMKKGIVM
jgi:hypothetical protein